MRRRPLRPLAASTPGSAAAEAQRSGAAHAARLRALPRAPCKALLGRSVPPTSLREQQIKEKLATLVSLQENGVGWGDIFDGIFPL